MSYEDEGAATVETWNIKPHESLCGREYTKQAKKYTTGFRCRRFW
ncbi:hypothetical protein [Planomicrobium okeanokoites]|nr:hypothetical protein [Planomicrobium okeanokoites]